MSIRGRAAVAMWWDVPPAVRAEWEDWHTREHMPERLAIPGFLRGSRWAAITGKPSYFVLYEAARLATLTSGPYLERLNHPTPWSRRMMPHHRNMVRSLCRVRASHGEGVPAFLATIRFSPRGRLPRLPRRKGVTGARLLQARPMRGTPTAEQKIRGGDATADWVLLIGGYDARAVAAAARTLKLPAAKLGFYRLAYSLAS